MRCDAVLAGEVVEHVDEKRARGAEQPRCFKQGVRRFAVHLEREQRNFASRLCEEARGCKVLGGGCTVQLACAKRHSAAARRSPAASARSSELPPTFWSST